MKKERLVGLIMAVILSVVMGVVSSALVLLNNPEIANTSPVGMIYLSNILMSVVLGVIISFVVPFGKLGAMLAKKANANPPGIKFSLINAIPFAVGNTLIMSLVLSFIGILTARSKMPAEALSHLPPFAVMWLGNWLKLLLPTLLISYVVSVLVAPLVARIVGVGGPGPRKP